MPAVVPPARAPRVKGDAWHEDTPCLLGDGQWDRFGDYTLLAKENTAEDPRDEPGWLVNVAGDQHSLSVKVEVRGKATSKRADQKTQLRYFYPGSTEWRPCTAWRGAEYRTGPRDGAFNA